MAITRRSDFAVRLMHALAQLPAGSRLSARDLCQAAGVPETFGSAILPFLVEAQLVQASGYQNALLSLARPAEQITLASVIRAAEPEFSLAATVTGPWPCEDKGPAAVQALWRELDRLLWDRLGEITLADLDRQRLPDAAMLADVQPGVPEDRARRPGYS